MPHPVRKAGMWQVRPTRISMKIQPHSARARDLDIRLRLLDRLVYLPGALVLAYGFWLTLST